MAVFTYMALDTAGRKICGHREAASKENVEQFLRKKGFEKNSVFSSKTVFSRKIYKKTKPSELAELFRQMNIVFFSGIQSENGILQLSEHIENVQIKNALAEICERLNEGYTIAEAFGMYGHVFGNQTVTVLSRVNKALTIESAFSELCDYFEQIERMKRKIKSVLIYPAVLVVVTIVVTLALTLKILPMFEDILNSMGGKIPTAANAVYKTITIVNTSFLLIAALAVVAVFFASAWIKIRKGALVFDKLKMKMPLLKEIVVKNAVSKFSRGLSVLLNAGVNFPGAVAEAAVFVENRYIESEIREAAAKIRAGESVEAAFSGLFPGLFLQMLYIGQAAGRMDKQVEKACEIYEKQANDAVDRACGVVEPLTVAFLSVIIIGIIISVMLPLISIMNSIR